MLKKVLYVVSAAIFTVSAVAYAFATKQPEFPVKNNKNTGSYSYYEDFESYASGDAPSGMTLFNSSSVSKTEVAETSSHNGKKGKTLLVSDNDTAGNSAVTIKIPTSEKSATVEIKFKAGQTDSSALPAYFQLKNASGVAMQVAITKLGELFYNGDEKAYPIGNRRMVANLWYTLKLRPDYEKQTVDIYLSGEQLMEDNYTADTEFRLDRKKGQMIAVNLPLKASAQGKPADTLYIVTSGNTYTGNIWVDDIGVTLNTSEIPFLMDKPPKIIPETVEAPLMRKPEGKITLIKDGKYFYFAGEPRYSGNILMIKYTDASRLFRMLYRLDGDKIELTSDGNKLVFTKNSASAEINGKNVKLSAEVTSDGYIPLSDVADAFEMSLTDEDGNLKLEGGNE